MKRLLLLITCIVTLSMAQFYPAINGSSGWDFYGSKGTISSAYIPIILEDGVTQSRKKIFYRVSFEEANVCSMNLPKENFTHDRDVIGGYRYVQWLYSYYSVDCHDGITREMYVEYLFYASGDFSFKVQWTNDPGNTAGYAKFKVDYDIDGAADNIVDYVNYGSTVPQYTAQATEHWLNANDLEKFQENAIEVSTIARFTKAVSPEQQVGFVFLQTAETPYTLTFKKYPGKTDNPDNSVSMQSVGSSTSNSYAYSGSDQVVWVRLNENPDRMGSFAIKGKTFVRPNARPMKLYVNMQSGLSAINFSQQIGGGKTLSDAINSLTNSKWEQVTTTGINNPYGSSITKAQLHEFMLNARSTNGVYNNRNETSKYIAEANIVNSTYFDNASWHGVMFDDVSSGNQTYREGFAILYKKIDDALSYQSEINEQVAKTFAHELGHVFNFSHGMSGCNGTGCSGSEVPTLMSYCTYISSKRLNNTCTGEYNTPAIDFYQNGPESWVKSGRFGIDFMNFSSVPSYTEYQ